MPVIKIDEIEQVSFTAFDATENVVLIPMLYARDYTWHPANLENPGNAGGYAEYKELQVPAKKYTSYKTFKEDMLNHIIIYEGSEELDKSYVMAYELLLQGLSVVIKPILFDNAQYDPEDSEGQKRKSYQVTVPLEDAYRLIEKSIKAGDLDEFKDRNLFNIKFITSGGYANCGTIFNGKDKITLGSNVVLQNIARERGDAIALVEYRPLFTSKEELLSEVEEGVTSSEYAAAFFPWCICRVTADPNSDGYEMPASFCYLSAYANSVQYSANWFAAAGVNRGRVPNLIKPLFEVGEALMHSLQSDDEAKGTGLLNITINPIYNAGNYGYRIWGNRVYTKNTQNLFTNFLNVRILLCDIKKQIYHAAMRVTFEPNDDIVWVNFKTLTSTPLERMKSGRGISWYKWTREYTNQKATIKGTLTIRPIEAVESFDISVVLTDEEAIIEETTSDSI